MGDMKEIRDAASAYYNNLSEKQKLVVSTTFRNWDTDGDGAITIKEFEQIIGNSSDRINRMFHELDKNGDGGLDFEESVTFFYCLTHKRILRCDGCNVSFIKGLYFTCVDCFDHNQTTTFDLCTSCYGRRNYVHCHSNFLDNYALLRSKAAYENKSGSINQMGVLKALNTGVHVGIDIANDGVDIANDGVDIASTAVDIASSCSIM